jgi:NAD(P)-dependent dehydrogenase (short-subunit alcohol dehydrogenase family)
MHLKGKKVLITGGSSGIGFAIAEAALAKGADVAITGRRQDVVMEAARQLRRGGHRVESVAADVSSASSREATLKLSLEKLGGLDVLVDNAGGER